MKLYENRSSLGARSRYISCAVYSVRTAFGGKATAAYVNALLNYSCRNFARRGERKRLASPPQVPRRPPERAAFYHAEGVHIIQPKVGISSRRRWAYHPTEGWYIITPKACMLSYTYPRASGERAHYPRRERRPRRSVSSGFSIRTHYICRAGLLNPPLRTA